MRHFSPMCHCLPPHCPPSPSLRRALAGYTDCPQYVISQKQKLTCPPPPSLSRKPVFCFFLSNHWPQHQAEHGWLPFCQWHSSLNPQSALQALLDRPQVEKKQVLETLNESIKQKLSHTLWVHLNLTYCVDILRSLFIKMLCNGLLRVYKTVITWYFLKKM